MDKRTRSYKRMAKVKQYVWSGEMACTLILALLAACILAKSLSDTYNKKLIDPRTPGMENLDIGGNKPAVKRLVQEVEAKEPLAWNDAIRQVFPSDEAGRMIRICMTENKKQDRYAINKNKNGSYDASWCQINSIHKPKTMSHEEWVTNLQDPKFHAEQVRKIYLSQGWSAWVVWNKNLVK